MPSKHHKSPGLHSGFKGTSTQRAAWASRDAAAGDREGLLQEILETNGKKDAWREALKTYPNIERFTIAKPYIVDWFKSEWIPGGLLELSSEVYKVVINENLYVYFQQIDITEWVFILIDWKNRKIAQETLDWFEHLEEGYEECVKEFCSESLDTFFWQDLRNCRGDGIASSTETFIGGSTMATLLFMVGEGK